MSTTEHRHRLSTAGVATTVAVAVIGVGLVALIAGLIAYTSTVPTHQLAILAGAGLVAVAVKTGETLRGVRRRRATPKSAWM